jgi:hypothetical protein
VDPVTGLSRRATLGLVAAIVVGVVGGTVAQYVAARGKPGCPDRQYGCARIEPGEPIEVGALFPADDPSQFAAVAARFESDPLLGHPLHIVDRDGPCSAEATAEAAREFATDPPDGPPVIAVVGETCPAAEIPVAQILNDSGITFVSALEPAQVPGGAPFYLTGPGADIDEPGVVDLDDSGGLEPAEVAAYTATLAVIDAIRQVAAEHEGDLLVPRTELRDALLEAGLSPASGAVAPAMAAAPNG